MVQYSATGEYQTDWSITSVLRTNGIAVGPGGEVYVTVNNSHRVVQYSATGQYLTEWGLEAGAPGAIAVAPGSGTHISEASGSETSGGQVYVTTHQNWDPYTPSNPSPEHQATGVNLPLTLSWTGGDPDGDTVIYNIYGQAATWVTSTLWYSGTATSFAPGVVLTSGITYTWKVDATDPWDGVTSGPVWEFTTGVYKIYLPLVRR
ncbi:MAG: hypothetical protein ABIG63_09210 [Chloroflexota bacterium]